MPRTETRLVSRLDGGKHFLANVSVSRVYGFSGLPASNSKLITFINCTFHNTYNMVAGPKSCPTEALKVGVVSCFAEFGIFIEYHQVMQGVLEGQLKMFT